MKEFKIYFERTETLAYSTTIKAKTEEEAIKRFNNGERDEDEHEDELIDSDIDSDSAKVTGYWENGSLIVTK